MGLYIEGIEEPIAGQVIEIAEGIEGKIYARISPGFDYWHPVHYISAHGRLIDADEIKKRISHMNMEAYMDGACYGIHPSLEYLDLLNEILDDAPTIIEAEGDK